MWNRPMVLRLGLAALLMMSACRFNAALDDKGGGTITLAYRVGKNGSVAKAKRNFLSPNIRIVKIAMDKDKWVTAELAFDDVTKLSTARLFKNLTVTRTVDKDGAVTLDGKMVNKHPTKVPQDALDYYGKEVVVTVTAPGQIAKTNATTKDGTTATWKWPAEALFGATETVMQLSYAGRAAKAEATPD